MLPLAVRPIRSLWLLCVCVLLLPLSAAAGEHQPDAFAHRHDYLARSSGAPQLVSPPATRVFPTPAEDAEDDDSDASTTDGSVLLALAAVLLDGPSHAVVIARFADDLVGPRSSSAILPFVPRPPPALSSF